VTGEVVRKPLGEEGLAWIRDSLGRGRGLSRTLLSVRSIENGTCFALVHPESQLADFDQGGTGISHAAKRELGRFLAEATEYRGQNTLVVEDELALDTDPNADPHAELVADGQGGIFYWMAVTPSTVAAGPDFIDMSSSGFPTNAFLLGGSIDDLGVQAGRVRCVERLARTLQASLIAVIVAAFDAESWVIWSP
jgi:hypothetical protein